MQAYTYDHMKGIGITRHLLPLILLLRMHMIPTNYMLLYTYAHTSTHTLPHTRTHSYTATHTQRTLYSCTYTLSRRH